jgi:broad specificity phosphatase PhoE
MGQLFLVRHGQASLGSHDYDQLSDLGHRQAERLGHYWRERDQQFDAVVIGGLRRHAQTWAAIAKGADYSHES